MKNVNLIVLYIIVILLSACDYYGTYEFRVKNELKNSIAISFLNKESLVDTVTTMVIQPNSVVTLVTTGSENLGMTEALHGIHSDTVRAMKDMKIFYGDIQINKNFQEGSEWDYELVEKRRGVYILKVDPTDLK